MEAFRQKNYRESIRRFTAFLTKYRKHPYRDDALWRIANAYSAMHQPTETLTYLLAALEEPNADGEVWGVCLECDIFHTLELSTPADLETFARSSTSRQGARAAYFSLGMSQLADGALKDALVYFLTACLGTREAPQSERLTAEVGFACQAKVQILQKLADFDGQPSPDGDIARAEFLIANPDALVNSRGQFTQLADDQIPLDYYLARNANLRAGMLLENVLGQEPPGPRRIRLIKEAADAFDTAASGAALTDKATIEMLRDKAVHWYAELLSSTPSDSPDFELAFEAIPAVYMHRPKLGGSWLQVFTADEVRAIQSHYADLAARYPESPLADNALNWVAWGYCYLANLSPSDSAEYETNYASALEVYKHLAADYPMSSPAMNARENIPVIEGKLADRGKRVAVPEERWTWPLGQFPGLLQPGRP